MMSNCAERGGAFSGVQYRIAGGVSRLIGNRMRKRSETEQEACGVRHAIVLVLATGYGAWSVIYAMSMGWWTGKGQAFYLP
jgi:hypothetical protein